MSLANILVKRNHLSNSSRNLRETERERKRKRENVWNSDMLNILKVI